MRVFAAMVLALSCITAESGILKSPEEFSLVEKPGITRATQETPFVSLSLVLVIRVYQAAISSVKGETCPMYPSCSHYAAEAIEKHGFLGILMATDRLNRCGHDLRDYETLIVDGRIKYQDFVK